MVKSMTAFARAEADGICWEIRTVNQRYLDVNIRMPEPLRNLEVSLRGRLKQRIHRGKIDCQLHMDDARALDGELSVDDDMVMSLKQAVDHVSKLTGTTSSMNPMELLRWPGVIVENRSANEGMEEKIGTLFDEAVDALVDMREREGGELADFIAERLEQVGGIVRDVRDEAPDINRRLEARLRERLDSVKGEIDEHRLEQELVYMAQRSDILEELDRLDTHVEEIRSTLKEEGPVGRRLDFLMQELNREANTMSSKAVAASTSSRSVELKVLIEQMREQIQNIE